MLKKVTYLLVSLLLLLSLVIPAMGQTISFVADQAGLLLPEEIALLEEQASNLNDAYGIHPVIFIADSLNGNRAQDYADDYYDQSGYGDDGILFLLSMEEREWYISTSGSVIYALTDYGIQQVGEGAVSYFADGLWYEGFHYFLDALPEYLDALESGAPIDGYADYSGDYYHGDQEEVVYYEEEFTPFFLLSLFCGIVVAAVVVLIMRLCMNTRRPQRSAGAYQKEGSWQLTQHSDIFLYSNVTKTKKQDPPKSSGGGSSVHRSSGGRSHGGGGGKF